MMIPPNPGLGGCERVAIEANRTFGRSGNRQPPWAQGSCWSRP